MKSLKAVIFCVLLAALVFIMTPAVCEPLTVDISSATIQVLGGPFVYTGSYITPYVIVTLDGRPLMSYGLSHGYYDCVYAGTCTVRVYGDNYITVNDPVLGEVRYTGMAETTFEIQKAKVTVNFPSSDPGLVYNGASREIAWSVSGEAMPGSAMATISYAGPDPAHAAAGSYTAVVSIADTVNHEIIGANTYDFQIERAPVTVNFPASDPGLVYNGASQEIAWSVSGEASPGSAGATISYSGPDPARTAAGSYTAVVSIADTANHEIVGANSFDFEIRPAPVTVNFPASDPGLVYNGVSQGIDWSVSGEATPGEAGATISYSGPDPARTAAGFYTAVVSIADTANHVIVGANSFDFEIRPAPVTVNFPASDPGLVYNGTSLSIDWSVSGEATPGEAGASISYSGPDPARAGAGFYTAVVSIADTANHIIVGAYSYDFQIRPAPVTVHFPASDPGFVYNGQVQEIPWSVSGEVTPGGAGAFILYSGPGALPKNAAGYLATVMLTDTVNYEIAGACQYVFAILAAPITVSFPGGEYSERVYDGTAQTFDWSVSGELTPGDAGAYIEYSADAASLPPKNPGTYTAFVRLSNANYWIPGTFAHYMYIMKRPLTVTFSGGVDFTYNGQEQKPGFTVAGEADGEQPVVQAVLTGDYPEPKNSGLYTLSVSLTKAAVNANYQITGKNECTFYIAQVPVSFVFPASDPCYVYNGQAQTVPWSLTGAVDGEHPAACVNYHSNGTGTPTVTAGNHTAIGYLDPSSPVNANYVIRGTYYFDYTIAPAPVTVTFPDADPGYVYNGQVQTVPVTVSDPVEGEDPDYEIIYYQYAMQQEPRNAGPYMVWVYMPYNEVNANYQLIGSDFFEFFIRQKQLTVTPVAKEKLLGTDTPDPLLEYTVSGQLDGDVPVFQGELYCDWWEAPGEYEIRKGYLWLIYYDPANVNYSYEFAFTEGVAFTIRELENAPDAAYEPGVPDGENGWYVSPVRIVPPEGYFIGLSQSTDASAWQPYLQRPDGMHAGVVYYLRRVSDGAITSRKLMPAFNQDGRVPVISSVIVGSDGGRQPGLQITASDNVLLDKIVVLDGGKPVRIQSLIEKDVEKFTIVYPLIRPGQYNAMAYDAAGNMSQKTKVVTVADTDGDGLSDNWEAWQGTDPNEKDSDGDGIDDQTAYRLGAASGGRLPAAAALMLNAAGQDAGGEGVPESFYGSGLVSGLEDVREEDVHTAPKLDGTAVIVQFDPVTGEGWALSGGRLVHFGPQGDGFACDTVLALEGAFGALRLVALSSADGSVMLLAHWDDAAGRTEGPLKLLDTKAKKVSVLAGSEGATAFDLSRDGTRVAYTLGGRVHVVNIAKGTVDTVDHGSSALTFTSDGRLALGMDGANVLFYGEGGQVASEAYDGFVDAAQRTNTGRTINVVSGGVTQVTVNGTLTFTEDGKGIVFAGGNGTVDVAMPGEV